VRDFNGTLRSNAKASCQEETALARIQKRRTGRPSGGVENGGKQFAGEWVIGTKRDSLLSCRGDFEIGGSLGGSKGREQDGTL